MSDPYEVPDPTVQTTALSPITDAETPEERQFGLNTQERSAIEALPAGSALLIVRKGPNYGARFLLDADSTMAGRHPSCDIFLDDVTVSRKHAVFVRDDEGFSIRDMGSLNGTYVANERIDEARLANGQEVQIGKYRMTFHQIAA